MRNIFILILTILALNINAQDDYGKLNLTDYKKSWLRQDKRNFKNLIKFIDEKKFDNLVDIEKIKNLYKSRPAAIDSLDFGVKRFNFRLYGGYTTYYLTVCVLQNKIISFNFFLHREDYEILNLISQKDTAVKNGIHKLKEQWQTHKTYEGDCYTFNYENPENFKNYKKSFEAEFGELQNIEFNDSLTKKLYFYMINPISNYNYNSDLGLIIDTFSIKNWYSIEEIDIVKNVIKGYNPIGRVLAVEKLLILAQNKKYELTAEDFKNIKIIINSDIFIVWDKGHIGNYLKIKNFFKENTKLVELLKSNGIN